MGGYLLVAQPRKKRDPSFYPATSNARQRLLLNPHGQEQESRRLMKRSREKTVKQLIRLCRNTNEGEEPELAHLQGMLGRLRSKAEYMKRLSPAMLGQKRSMMKKAKQPSTKRSMVKLKRMLTECLMEKNILEGRGGGSAGGRKPTTQFLRFGRG